VASRARRPVLSARAGAWLALAVLPALGAAPPARLELETLAGKPVALAPPAGRTLLVHFFATWCPSCGEELPELARASAACAGAVEIALVDVDEEPAAVRNFLAEHGVELAALRDPGGRVWRSTTGARGLPANLIWKAGERRSEVGPRTLQAWRELLGELGCRDLPPPGAGR
jgi:thiol-disulfide isomerase/thioredoxin